MKRTVSAPNEEPEQRRFELPSEKEHKFQVVDKWEDESDPNVITTKIEVAGGDEEGRTTLHRVNLDSDWKGFFLTRLFLKAIGEPYKGEFEVDDDMWIGKSFYATIIHNTSENNGKTYANIDEFNFDKEIDQPILPQKEDKPQEQTMTPEEHQQKVDANEIEWDS